MDALDWGSAWLQAWRGRGEPVAACWQRSGALEGALNAHAHGSPVRFVAHSELPAGVAYEQFVFTERAVPVREGLHDFFNGLCWLQFPRTKAALNRLQAEQIAQAGIGGRRGPVRDAITVFDENGALLDAPPPLWDALLAREWRRLFVELRPLWRQARLLVFGHALLEQLLCPRKDLTAHVWRANAAINSIAELDGWLAAQCTSGQLAGKPFTPLPLLGVPGWCRENENFSFYDDSHVFRPRRAGVP